MGKQIENTPDEKGKITLKDLLKDCEMITNRWEKLGLLEGLDGNVKEETADLFRCDESHLINEMEEVQKLILAEDVFDTLKDGKTCTIRKGRRDIELGLLMFESLEKKRLALVGIKLIIYCSAFQIPEQYWRNDGFESVKDMIEQMKRFYPDMKGVTECTVVEFKLEPQNKIDWNEKSN